MLVLNQNSTSKGHKNLLDRSHNMSVRYLLSLLNFTDTLPRYFFPTQAKRTKRFTTNPRMDFLQDTAHHMAQETNSWPLRDLKS